MSSACGIVSHDCGFKEISLLALCETSTKHTHRQHDNVHTSGSLGRARPDVIPRSRPPLEDSCVMFCCSYRTLTETQMTRQRRHTSGRHSGARPDVTTRSGPPLKDVRKRRRRGEWRLRRGGGPGMHAGMYAPSVAGAGCAVNSCWTLDDGLADRGRDGKREKVLY